MLGRGAPRVHKLANQFARDHALPLTSVSNSTMRSVSLRSETVRPDERVPPTPELLAFPRQSPALIAIPKSTPAAPRCFPGS